MAFGLICLIVNTAWGQSRYLDEVFTEVTITQEVKYGINLSILSGAPDSVDLLMDVYEPTGDTVGVRPVVLFAHSGYYLPRIINGSPNGTRRDSVPVEICTRLAKMGYVAIAFSYRLGWNPISQDQNIRTASEVQALYRAIQDARNVVRFIRANVDTAGNDFRIDTNRIAIGGTGSGGFIALGAAYLHDFNELLLPKLFNLDSTPPEPYFDSIIHGNVWGTNVAALNLPNYPAYSSAVNFAFNMGGAILDSSWIDPGEPACVAFHTILDPLVPYKTGPVIVPFGDFVLETSGSYDVIKRTNVLGNNDLFIAANFTDAYSIAANQLNEGYEGLFPIDIPFSPGMLDCNFQGVMLPLFPEAAPWDWWDKAQFIADWDAVPGQTVPGVVASCNQLTPNPNMSSAKARTYIDSIVGYLAPRMALALGIDITTNLEDDLLEQQLEIFPNPTSSIFQVRLTGDRNMIEDIEVLDMTGREVMSRQNLRTQIYTIEIETPASGLYFVRVRTADGAVVTHKLLIES